MATPQAPEKAHLHTLKFSSVIEGQAGTLATLVEACERDGFFYLDLSGWDSGDMLTSLQAAGALMKEWFKQPLDKKMATETISDAHGYKPPGVQSGVTENTRDGFEALRISRTGMLNREHLPEIVRNNLSIFEKYQLSAHYVLMTLLTRLSDATGLQGNERYEAYHPDDLPSKSTMFFLHHPTTSALPGDQSGRGHNAHTDVGSFTLLVTEQPGLQVLSPVTGRWEYVDAKPGHAIINVADTLRFISGRRFRSAMHRVLPPGADGRMAQDRYSTAYFLRAGDDVVLTGMDGSQITAGEWFLSKYASFNQSTEEQRSNSIATGGMERDLGVAI
ncbi:uncharacterized protein B0I36DRAFT_366237 [Microdochium trichocladiopsis]|uniref:Fe2OG dioxygenase domain-containing protein n=1 Tax=Microdochium trichocladiopsis TaxID=1682393 RepID=A0A9P9BMX2_9PEZI|nr:uncharacterized protein B0I36DRAFT_366237 [Microdochium trichocladiopsis]KAH7026710.1 hypothetical protein B0I36DRAFT_366237 [Microdochium trichocladiopsis]